MDFLPGALDLDAAAFAVDPGLAGRVLWFDALVGNVDRSWRNPNMLFWHGGPYLIDHGAALTFQHLGAGARRCGRTTPREHALLGCAPRRGRRRRARWRRSVTRALAAAVAEVPDEWLRTSRRRPDARAAYVDALLARLAARTRGCRRCAAIAAASAGARRPRATGRAGWRCR